MFKLPRISRGCGKTILQTQRMMGVVFAKDFIQRLDAGENLTEKDFIEGLKEVYVQVGKLFRGDNDDSESD